MHFTRFFVCTIFLSLAAAWGLAEDGVRKTLPELRDRHNRALEQLQKDQRERFADFDRRMTRLVRAMENLKQERTKTEIRFAERAREIDHSFASELRSLQVLGLKEKGVGQEKQAGEPQGGEIRRARRPVKRNSVRCRLRLLRDRFRRLNRRLDKLIHRLAVVGREVEGGRDEPRPEAVQRLEKFLRHWEPDRLEIIRKCHKVDPAKARELTALSSREMQILERLRAVYPSMFRKVSRVHRLERERRILVRLLDSRSCRNPH